MRSERLIRRRGSRAVVFRKRAGDRDGRHRGEDMLEMTSQRVVHERELLSCLLPPLLADSPPLSLRTGRVMVQLPLLLL
jgi:hypothetical protein